MFLEKHADEKLTLSLTFKAHTTSLWLHLLFITTHCQKIISKQVQTRSTRKDLFRACFSTAQSFAFHSQFLRPATETSVLCLNFSLSFWTFNEYQLLFGECYTVHFHSLDNASSQNSKKHTEMTTEVPLLKTNAQAFGP